MEDESLIYKWQNPAVFQDAALRLIDIDPGDLFGNPQSHAHHNNQGDPGPPLIANSGPAPRSAS